MIVKELREKRAALIKEATGLLSDSMTSEDHLKFDQMDKDIESLRSQIGFLEKVQDKITEKDRELALRSWLVSGRGVVTTSGREAAKKFGIDLSQKVLAAETRADLTTASGADGGYTTPQLFSTRLESALKSHSGLRDVATILNTANGSQIRIVTVDDTSVVGEIVGENAAANEETFTFEQTLLNCYTYNSKLVPVSIELLQDEAVDLTAFITDALGKRLGRILNTHFTTGDGVNKPRGVVTASTLGKTAASATAITYAELVDLMHSVDPAYRGNAKWMFNDSTLAALKKLVDDNNRPLWSAGLNAGESDLLLGKPFVVNNDMASIATGNKSVLFGDFSNYVIRQNTKIDLMRLNERFADLHQMAFCAFLRADGDVVNAGTNPVKHLLQA